MAEKIINLKNGEGLSCFFYKYSNFAPKNQTMLRLYRTFVLVLSLTCFLGQLRADDEVHSHDGKTFMPHSDATSLPTTAGSYYLTCDVTLTKIWEIKSAQIIDLDLNGHTITMTTDNHVIKVEAKSTLNIYDCGKTVTYWEADSTYQYWKKKVDYETELITTGGCITGGKGYNVNSLKPLGTGSPATCLVGGGICNLGTLNIYGGNIVGNYSKNPGIFYGGGIYNGGALTIGKKAKVIGNSLYIKNGEYACYGAGVFNASGSASFTNNGEISHNYLSYIGTTNTTNGESQVGAGVCNYSANGFTNNGLIAYNTCKASSAKQGQGGGVFCETGTFTNTGRIIGNRASLGGGVLVKSSLVNSGEISGNIASDRGGGIQAWGQKETPATVTLNSGSRICDNQCTGDDTYGKTDASNGGYGGGLFVNIAKVLVNDGSVMTGNEAAHGGAAIYDKEGTVSLSGTVNISGNHLVGSTTTSNVLLYSGQKLTVAGSLDGSTIGVGIRATNTTNTTLTPTVGTVTSGYGTTVGTALKHFCIDGIYSANSIDVSGGEVAIGTSPITLSATADNSGLLAGNAGQAIGVTLDGRTYYKDGCWNTLCLPFSLTASQLSASPLAGAELMRLSESSLSGGVLTLTFSEATAVEAGVPYLAKWSKGDGIVSPSFTNVCIASSPVVTETAAVNFVGLLSPKTADPSTDILLGSENKVGYALKANAMKAFGAYFLDKSKSSAEARALQVVLDFGEAPTAISHTGIAGHTPGHGAWYTLQGQRLDSEPTRPGIYVRQGRKEVIR